MNKTTTAATAAATLLLLTTATATAAAATEPDAEPNGEKIYQNTCAPCHGIKGKGLQQGQLDFTNPETWNTMTKAGAYNYTKHGGTEAGLSMPPDGGTNLTQTQRRAVINYIATLPQKHRNKPDTDRYSLYQPNQNTQNQTYPVLTYENPGQRITLQKIQNKENQGWIPLPLIAPRERVTGAIGKNWLNPATIWGSTLALLALLLAAAVYSERRGVKR